MADLRDGDVLLEFQRVGNVVRVSAIDPASNTEVVVQGPAEYGEATLRRTALAKLNYVLRKKRAAESGGTGPEPPLLPGGPGLVV